MKTAIVICSYNMPEYTDALVEHIHETVKLPYDLMVFDNGSDMVHPSKYTIYREETNIQMVPGFMKALRLLTDKNNYDFYWLMTTSCRFDPKDSRDPLEILLPMLHEHDVYSVQPSLIIDYGAWKEYLAPREPYVLRQVHSLECVCPLYRADHFDSLGRWREELTFGWGFAPEIHWKARKNGLKIYTHDGYVMYKDTEIGYHMGRMGMSARKRRCLAGREADKVLNQIYETDDWRAVLNHGLRWV